MDNEGYLDSGFLIPAGVLLFVALIIGWEPILNLLGVSLPPDVFKITWPITLTTFSEVISGTGTLIVTIGLFLLYKRQTEILDQQEEWMEAGHVPDVYVESWKFQTPQQFIFKLSNLGTGVAKNLTACVELKPEYRSGETNITKISVNAPLAQSAIFSRVLPTSSNLDDAVVNFNGRVNNIEVHLEYGRTFDIASEEMYSALSYILEYLARDSKSVRYKVDIKYDYIRRRDDQKSVFYAQTTLESDIDLEGLFLGDPEQILDSDLNLQPNYDGDL